MSHSMPIEQGRTPYIMDFAQISLRGTCTIAIEEITKEKFKFHFVAPLWPLKVRPLQNMAYFSEPLFQDQL
jgi:hypothetical protein